MGHGRKECPDSGPPTVWSQDIWGSCTLTSTIGPEINLSDSVHTQRHDEKLAHSPWFQLWQQYGICCRRPQSANRNTIKAMERRGLISPGKGPDPLAIVWRLKNKNT